MPVAASFFARARLAALTAALVACGARSNLRELAAGSGGGGPQPIGAGAGGTGGSGGAGGTGGAAGGGGPGGTGGMPIDWPCPIVVDGPIGVAGAGTFHQQQPRLSFSSDDRSQVTVAMRWQMPGGPATPAELRHVSFSPWGAWPNADVAPSYLADLNRGSSFAIAPAAGNHFALLMTSGKPGTGVVFAPAMTPGSGALSPLTKINDGTIALFLAARGDQYLAAHFPSQVLPNAKAVQTLTVTGEPIGSPIPIICAGIYQAQGGGAIPSAIPSNSGWLMALSGVGKFGPFPCQSDEQYESQIRIMWVTPAAAAVMSELATGSNIGFVVLTAATQQNPWLAWGGNNGPPGNDGVVRLDAAGTLLGQVAVPNPGYNRFAAAPLLNGLLLIRGYANSVNLTFVHPNGAVSSTMPVAALNGAGVVDALASPDGKAVLIGLVTGPGAPFGDRIELARIRCQ